MGYMYMAIDHCMQQNFNGLASTIKKLPKHTVQKFQHVTLLTSLTMSLNYENKSCMKNKEL